MNSTADALTVSVIVPVYNVEPYLEPGLDSILGQDFERDYEILLIDDCSSDRSLEICRRCAKTHPRQVRLFENEHNLGVSAARNRGLEQARGRYVMFVDPDDLLPPSALSDLVGACERFQADIVKGNLVLFDESSERAAPDRVESTRQLSGDDVLTALFDHTRVRGHIGGKLFRRACLGSIRFTPGVRMAQDLLFFSELFANAESLVLLARTVYRYRKHQTGSTAGKYRRGSYVDWLGAVEQAGRFARSRRQRRAHKSLLLRTLTQIAREVRKISPPDAVKVLALIEQKCREWGVRPSQLLFRDRLGLRNFSRYIKLNLALRQIRDQLARSR